MRQMTPRTYNEVKDRENRENREEVGERMDAQYRLEMQHGTLMVYPGANCAVSIVGRDGLVATVVTGDGQLVVRLDKNSDALWSHTFSYSPNTGDPRQDQDPPKQNGVDDTSQLPPNLIQRRPRGRPRGSASVPRPGQVMNLDGELVSVK